MARLHKEKQSPAPQSARSSTQPRMQAVRLTPAEIRAQNNGEATRSQSQLALNKSSRNLSEQRVTPPSSPSKEKTAYQTQLANTASQQKPPTPPRSPRLFDSKTVATNQNGLPAQHGASYHRQTISTDTYRGMVGTPVPSNSRSSSISGSIKAPMKYRGHEITRTGSLNLFQAPQPDIVMNPLSNFSRPRNKYSPPGSFNRQDGRYSIYEAQHRRNDTADSAISLPSRSYTPGLRCDSPISTRSGGDRIIKQFVIVTEDSMPKEEAKLKHNQQQELEQKSGQRAEKKSENLEQKTEPKTENLSEQKTEMQPERKTEEIFESKTERQSELSREQKHENTAPSLKVDVEKPPQELQSPKRIRVMKKSTSVDLDQLVDTAAMKETKKKRRHTFSWKRMSGMDLKAEFKKPLERAKEETATAQVENSPTQNIGEPTEQIVGPTAADKGKGKEMVQDVHQQIVGVKCCDKCGRIKKMRDGSARVYDGVTREPMVLAGPSSYKLVRSSDDLRGFSSNPAGSANAAQLIMHRQRRPKPEKPVALPNECVVKDFAAGPPQTEQVDKQHIEPPVIFTRFASLHGISREKAVTPLTTVDLEQATDAPEMKATSTPIDEPLPEFAYDPAQDEEFLVAPAKPRRYSFESQRSILNVVPLAASAESEQSAPEAGIKKAEPIDLSKPIVLPDPNLGVRFSRSNLALRGLVLPKGGSSSNLLEDALKAANGNEIERGLAVSDQIDQARKKQETMVNEIMAV